MNDGLWVSLGKLAVAFQDSIVIKSGCDPEPYFKVHRSPKSEGGFTFSGCDNDADVKAKAID